MLSVLSRDGRVKVIVFDETAEGVTVEFWTACGRADLDDPSQGQGWMWRRQWAVLSELPFSECLRLADGMVSDVVDDRPRSFVPVGYRSPLI